MMFDSSTVLRNTHSIPSPRSLGTKGRGIRHGIRIEKPAGPHQGLARRWYLFLFLSLAISLISIIFVLRCL